MTELIWEGKYNKNGPVRIALPFQTVETVNESAQDRGRMLDMFSKGKTGEWRNRLIWGDKKYVLPSLLPEFAGKDIIQRKIDATDAQIDKLVYELYGLTEAEIAVEEGKVLNYD